MYQAERRVGQLAGISGFTDRQHVEFALGVVQQIDVNSGATLDRAMHARRAPVGAQQMLAACLGRRRALQATREGGGTSCPCHRRRCYKRNGR
jgi:hypothetical protein